MKNFKILQPRISMIACAALAALLLASVGAMAAETTAKPAALEGVALQKEILAKLTGESEIQPGVKLANRATTETKQAARAYLVDLLKGFGLEPKRQPYGTAGGVNIYAILAGDHSSTGTIVLGAHYDSVPAGPGANDDGSGVAAVAAVAKAMSSVKGRTRDIIFIFFDEEERGLRGSRAFAQMLLDEKRPVLSVHTIDQVAWDQNNNRAVELELPYDGAVALYRKAADTLGMKIDLWESTETGSDHSSFRRLGFKAIGVTEEYRHRDANGQNDTTPFIHKAGDTYATINFDYLASTTRLMVEVMTLLTH
jgi:hypothetical protein